jgi:hypothetical protein
MNDQQKIEKIARQLMSDFPLYAKNILKVITKNGEVSPLHLNPGQMMMHRMVEQQLKETGKIRVLALKARQVGISTYAEARFFWRITQSKNANAFVLSHLAESTNAIFNMVKFFYDNVPHPAFKPALNSQSASTLVFDGINSRYRVGTARSTQTGRGQTNRFVHGSEVAFYPQGADIVAGLLQTVGGQGSEVILETTANGAGGWYYDQVMKSLRGETDWTTVFIPWFVLPEYRRKPSPYFERTSEEDKLAARFNLDDAQLAFRRAKLDELGGTDLFKQEYPSTALEAFLTSGRCFVEDKFLQSAEQECYTPDFVGDFRNGQLSPHANGNYKEWCSPRKEDSYVLGIDVAEGLSHGDYSVIQILDSLGRQVGCWHGHIDPYELGNLASEMGKRWNTGYVIVERNNHGLTTLRRLQELEYPNLFVEHTVDNAYADRQTKRGGFLTTSKTKPLIIDNLARLLRLEESGIADTELIGECRTYVIDEKGAFNAQNGCYDDRVMAFAIALHGLGSMPRPRIHIARTRRFKTIDSTVGY